MHVSTDFRLRAVHRGDISLMSEFMHTGNSSQPDLISLNIMRVHKKVIHRSDIVLCCGKTIKAEMLTDQPGDSDVHWFPTQRPTPTNLNLWKLAVCKLSSNFHVFMVKLQEYISPPHNHPRWMLNDIGAILHHNILCKVIRRTTRSTHHLQIQSIAEPGWDNVSTLQSWRMAYPILISVQALLLLSWDRFFYNPWYQGSYLYVQSLDLNIW